MTGHVFLAAPPHRMKKKPTCHLEGVSPDGSAFPRAMSAF